MLYRPHFGVDSTTAEFGGARDPRLYWKRQPISFSEVDEILQYFRDVDFDGVDESRLFSNRQPYRLGRSTRSYFIVRSKASDFCGFELLILGWNQQINTPTQLNGAVEPLHRTRTANLCDGARVACSGNK